MPDRSQNGDHPRRGLGTARVTGRSMRPTLAAGDLLLVAWSARVRAGALVVLRLPGGRPLSVKRALRRDCEGWWVERDNPDEGVDSWSLGAVAGSDVLGVVLARLWPRPRWLHPRRPAAGVSP